MGCGVAKQDGGCWLKNFIPLSDTMHTVWSRRFRFGKGWLLGNLIRGDVLTAVVMVARWLGISYCTVMIMSEIKGKFGHFIIIARIMLLTFIDT